MSDCINGEIISVTVTVDEETVIGTINTAARGPQGEPGTGGGGAWNELTGTADAIPFTVTTAPAHSEGKVYYDSTDHSLTYFVDEAEVAMNIGREMWIRVRNNSGSTISNGKVVYLSGATGQTPTIALARADTLTTSRVIGVATHDIENNSFGYVTTVGEVKGLNTSAYTDGVMLFLSASTAGELTTTAPTAPNRAIQVATVSHAHVSQGKLFCHPETDSIDSTGIADSTSIGRALVTASTASVGRTTLGSTTVGDALFTAATAEVARTTLMVEILKYDPNAAAPRTNPTFSDDDVLAGINLTAGLWEISFYFAHDAGTCGVQARFRFGTPASVDAPNGQNYGYVYRGNQALASLTYTSATGTMTANPSTTAITNWHHTGQLIINVTGNTTFAMQYQYGTSVVGQTITRRAGAFLRARKIA